MDRSLKYISISHKNAPVIQREKYYISEIEKEDLVNLICKSFPEIKGLLILSTCNRTEIYFESVGISATSIRDFFIIYKIGQNIKGNAPLFRYSNTTEGTIKHLLLVSSGLESMVIGDAEIIHQIKKAYHFAMAHKLQGSLLERALQTVFKTHKRISNETTFRDGTTSVAYKSLKVIRDSYAKTTVKSKKILFVGAGDIVKQLFKYNNKFNFSNIYISNRSQEKAEVLAKINNSKTYDWNKVIENNFQDFDVIISAVSNCRHIIKNIGDSTKKIILIDLAVPSNIDKSMTQSENIIYFDLDTISVELKETKEKRLAATNQISTIINEEFYLYLQWIQKAPFRELIAKYKTMVSKKVQNHFEEHLGSHNIQKMKEITNQVMRKLMEENGTINTSLKIDSLILQHIER
ncbi:glutamyl-tRNA reductase [Changchengzhania lutea]|uniref:glutamyl-tRNA reductase n=1 Tax=Changchengzhania lutea TaxID=2049305 RepID=UPI00115F3B06|nr:glutamyl-tRNA reductase [Changchengzhania lutea]